MNMIFLDLNPVVYLPKDSHLICELLNIEVPQLNYKEEFKNVSYFVKIKGEFKEQRPLQQFQRLLLDAVSSKSFDYLIHYSWRVDGDHHYDHVVRIRPTETLKNNGCYLVTTNPLFWVQRNFFSQITPMRRVFSDIKVKDPFFCQPALDPMSILRKTAKIFNRTEEDRLLKDQKEPFRVFVKDDMRVPPVDWSRYASWLNSNTEQTLPVPTLDNLYQTNLKAPLSSQPVKNEDDQEREYQLFKRENGIENMLMYEDDVSKVTGIPVGTLRDMVKEENGFPRPVRISKRRKAWRAKDIFLWDKSLKYID